MNILTEFPQVTVTSNTIVALDIEVSGQDDKRLHRPTGEFACISICFGGEDVYVLQDQSRLQDLFEYLNPAKYWIMQNAQYDVRHLRRWAFIQDRDIFDTMLVEKILWGGYYNQGEFSLADMVRRYLDIKMDKSVRDRFAYGEAMDEQMLRYAATDAYLTYQVHDAQQKEIADRQYDMAVYWKVDLPAMWSLLDFKPVHVNVPGWLQLTEKFDELGADLEDKLGINVASPKQVKDFILSEYRKDIKDTKAETLNAMSAKYP